MATGTKKGIRKKPKTLCVLGDIRNNLKDACEELLLVAAIDYVLSNEDQDLRALVRDIKRTVMLQALPCATVIAKDPTLLQLMHEPLSLDYESGDNENNSFVDTIASHTPTPEDASSFRSGTKLLIQLIDSSNLLPRNKEILCRYYGLKGFQEMTFDELGPLFDLSRERPRQIVNSAARQLRERAIKMGLTLDCFLTQP